MLRIAQKLLFRSELFAVKDQIFFLREFFIGKRIIKDGRILFSLLLGAESVHHQSALRHDFPFPKGASCKQKRNFAPCINFCAQPEAAVNRLDYGGHRGFSRVGQKVKQGPHLCWSPFFAVFPEAA